VLLVNDNTLGFVEDSESFIVCISDRFRTFTPEGWEGKYGLFSSGFPSPFYSCKLERDEDAK
jgi:hypothetical protein